MVPVLQDELRHIFQRSLIEDKLDVLHSVEEVSTSLRLKVETVRHCAV